MSAVRGNILRWLLHMPVLLYRCRLGWLVGHRFLLLTHVGRRSARRHQTVLEVMEYRKGIPEAVVMSGFGPKADWLRNLEANGIAEIQIGPERFAATFRRLDPGDAVDVVKGYEHRNRGIALIVRHVLTGLLGWPYHGTDGDRRRLVEQLPLIAFRPRN